MKRFLKSLLTVILSAALIMGGVLYGPRLYALLFGGANANWISERFSEKLIQRSELIVLEKTITGQENISTDAWLIGTVQEVVIPYSFTASFSVDLSAASVACDEANNVIEVFLPVPEIVYYKLTVDEDSVKKYDFLYPLTSERYTEMKQEMEEKLYNEVANDAELAQSAWAAAVIETEKLYQELLDAYGATADFAVEVLQAQPQE